MVVFIFLGGVARMVGTPLNWTIDLATCAIAWATFLAADVAWRRDLLMSVDLVPSALPRAGRRVLAVVNHVLILGFLAFLVWTGAELAWSSRARSFQGIPEVSYSFVTASLPVGAALLFLTTLGKLGRIFRGDPPDAAPAGQGTGDGS
jgi:TRAP-type C4-dicarboxylate transport system permease small subunit